MNTVELIKKIEVLFILDLKHNLFIYLLIALYKLFYINNTQNIKNLY